MDLLSFCGGYRKELGSKKSSFPIRDLAYMGEREEEKTEEGVSDDIPDWTREAPQRFWDPGRKLRFRSGVISIGIVKEG
jgi:hypothetical protein